MRAAREVLATGMISDLALGERLLKIGVIGEFDGLRDSFLSLTREPKKKPKWEPKKKLGRGVAYGACGPNHLLNVPVSRMEIGLAPSFALNKSASSARSVCEIILNGTNAAPSFASNQYALPPCSQRVKSAQLNFAFSTSLAKRRTPTLSKS